MINGKLYMSGGRTNPDEVLSNTWGYDIATDTWTALDQLLDMPMAKNTAGRAVVQGQLYAIGGTNLPTFDGLNDVSKYDVATNTWSPVPPLIAARSFTASVAVGNTMIAAGGRVNVDDRARQRREARRGRATATAATTASAATTATAAATSATASATTATATATASATTSAATSATAASAPPTASASATSGSLPRAAGDRTQARQREAADPQGQLPRRQRPPRSHQAIAARPRHRSEPEARRRQAPGLPGQPARRPVID